MERFTKFFTSLGGVLTSLAALIGGVVALYVAFGGGDEKASGGSNPATVVATTSSASLEDWRTRVQEVCRDAEQQANRLGPDPDVADSEARIQRLNDLIPILSSFANQIRALDEPGEVQADVNHLLDKMDQATDAAQTLVNSFQAGDADTVETARLELQAAGTDADRLLAGLGLKRCVTFS